MKKNDMVTIVAIAIFAAVFALVLSQIIFGKQSKKMSAEKVDPISAQFNKPAEDDSIFNSRAIDPTQLIQIGDTNNKDPF